MKSKVSQSFFFKLIGFITILSICGCKPADQRPDSPFGVLVFLPWNHDWNRFMYPDDKALRAMDLIQEAGIKWVRMDFSWTYLQPEENHPIDFEHFDWLVRELRKRDIHILGVLGYTPPWASDSGEWLAAPKDFNRFADYVAKTVGHYQGQVDHWEIWNEPNLSLYWQPQDGLKTYGELLKISYQAAKAANPKCVVSNGGLSINTPRDMSTLYDLGLQNYFDFYNVHLFVGNVMLTVEKDIIDALHQLRQIMDDHGDVDKPLWITEIGLPGLTKKIKEETPSLRHKPDENRQAAFLTSVMTTIANTTEADKVFWAFFQDTPGFFPDGLDYLGLVRGDFSVKPAYTAYQRFITAPDEE